MADLTRRGFLSVTAGALAGAGLAACAGPAATSGQAAAGSVGSAGSSAAVGQAADDAQVAGSAALEPQVAAEPRTVSEGPDDAAGFVLLADAVPDAIQEIRYYSTYNFVGERIDGYEQPVALITREAGEALREASDALVAQGYRLKVFDAYRPQCAVEHFARWAEDLSDTRMKPYFYPDLDKSVLFSQGYINHRSGHTRGSTVDLTLFDMAMEREVDMGGTFDFFGEISHPDYRGITDEQYALRMVLHEAMLGAGFAPLDVEWWHFCLDQEPYPDTYFTFPVSESSLLA